VFILYDGQFLPRTKQFKGDIFRVEVFVWFWRARFTIVAFICSLLQYFRAMVCFALQPFTISGEDRQIKKTTIVNNIDFSLSIGQY
jgi:hypothetical protein